MHWNQLIAQLTGLGVVTTPAVALWVLIAILTCLIQHSAQVAEYVARFPRVAKWLAVLEAAGFDPKSTAKRVRDALVREEQRLEL